MYTDIPLFKRCCFCLPLRQGLIAWGYIKLIYNIMMLVFEAYQLRICIDGLKYWNSTKSIVILSILTFASLVDIVFGIMFIVSAHMKNHKIMKIYYNYCLVMLILTILFVIGFLIFICVRIGDVTTSVPYYGNIVRIIGTYVQVLVCVLFDAFLFIYMVLLVRSEVLKLETNLQCKFVNPMCAGADEGKETREAAVYNRLSSDPGSVYAQCTVNVVD